MTSVRSQLERWVAQHFPGGHLVEVERLHPDRGPHEATHKAVGYGEPLRLRVVDQDGHGHDLVFHTAASDLFGHDRRSDRAAAMLLAYDTFSSVPGQAAALDVGALCRTGDVVSLRQAGEFFLVTEYAPGSLYATDLRNIARAGQASPADFTRVEALAEHLVAMHAKKLELRPRKGGSRGCAERGGRTSPLNDAHALYLRAVRDLVGHGEGIFGMIDAYGAQTPGAPPERLRAIEHACLEWRWRLREYSHRLRRTHGDFHPFNLVFTPDHRLSLLDASRGSVGDPADDVAALSINFPFFALGYHSAWTEAMRPLWQRFWRSYLSGIGDEEILTVIAPFYAWRGLVVASPRFYPDMQPRERDRILRFVERVLGRPRFELTDVEVMFP